MRFKIKPEIELGKLRIKKRFAFLPIDIKNECVWLERYYSLEKYCQDMFAGQKRGKVWRVISTSCDPTRWDVWGEIIEL